MTLYGHRRVRSLLKENVINPKDYSSPLSKWPIIGQFSSIGTLGPDENSWVCSELKTSFSAPLNPLEDSTIKLVRNQLHVFK